MALHSSAELTRSLRSSLRGLGAALGAVALTLGLVGPVGAATGTGDITQLSGASGLDGCVSRDGSEGGTTATDIVCETEARLSAPDVVVISPDGKFVYVGQAASGKILVFALNKSSKNGNSFGSLIVPASSATADGGHKGMVISQDGKHLYLTAGANLYMFSRDKKTGGLTALNPAKIQNLHSPDGLAMTSDGKTLYVASRGLKGIVVLARDTKTGLLTRMSCVGVDPAPSDGCTPIVGLKGATDVTISQDGKHVYATGDASNAVAMFNRDKKTGALTQAAIPDGCWSQTGQDGSTGPIVCRQGRGLNGVNGIAMPADGKFVYVTSSNSNAIALFSRDTKTGDLQQLPDAEGCVSENGDDGSAAAGEGLCTAADVGGLVKVQKLVISGSGANLYTSARGSGAHHKGAVSAFARDETTGALTQLSCVGPDTDCGDIGVALHQLSGIAISKDGRNLYTAATGDDAVAAFAIDK
jgi:6-phosphogluconolactonase (cycloisomerase 2 family)